MEILLLFGAVILTLTLNGVKGEGKDLQLPSDPKTAYFPTCRLTPRDAVDLLITDIFSDT
jgi:hypothetical protein